MKLNRPLTLEEKIKDASQHNETVPLKGQIKLVLEDVRDGTQQVEEVHNIQTDAVQTILNHNFSGLANYASLLPLRQLYGGVFCFQNAQLEMASNFYPPCDLDNPLIAHAGDAANNTGSTLRGSPVTNDFVITDTSIKQVWLWDNTQGNGHIESISLVPALLGNMGLKPYDDEFSPFSTMGNGTEIVGSSTLDDTEIVDYPFNISDDGKTSTSIYMDGTSFKEITVRHDYFAFGIMRGVDDFQTVTSRTATIRAGASGGSRIVFDDASYYYVAQAYYDSQTSKYGLYIDKISKETFAVTQADVQYETVTLYTGTIYEDMKGTQRTFAFDGTYLYFPNNAGTGFVKLNLSDTSDKMAIDGTISIGMGRTPVASAGRQYSTPIAINSGLVLGSNYIINGAKAYPIKHTSQIFVSDGNYGNNSNLILVQKGASMYAKTRYYRASAYRTTQGNLVCNMFISSIANLPQARNKSTSQTMRVEYTSTEQT